MEEKNNKDSIPQPTTARAEPRRGLGWLPKSVLISVLLVLVLPYLRSGNKDEAALTSEDADVAAYWTGIATRGYRATLAKALGKDQHHEHDHPSHGHGHGHGHRRWITPKRAEEIYLTVPGNDSVAAASKRYTSQAHPAGSGWDFVTALLVKNDWERELGLRVSGPEEFIYDAGSKESQARIKKGGDKLGVWIDTYYPSMNTPVHSSITLLTDPPVRAQNREEYLEGDPDSIHADDVPPFHGYSKSGDVTAKFFYAGYGRKIDFDLLAEKGVEMEGKIAIVKYGGVFRGLKVKAAAEAGAVGCIIYSDPGDDGEVTEANGFKPYPEGTARVHTSVQRGSVQYLSKYPGDPTTPGRPAYKDAEREEGTNIPPIPSLPLSFHDAIPILKALKGKGIGAGDLGDTFGGGLGHWDVEYWTGPSEVDLRLVNEMNTRIMPIWNTMAVIPGHITDEVIVMGNHRDAWVLGGSDPNAGTSSQFELVRGLGKLIRKGWKPMRTIVLASWDGEEYGLVGSTEWCEDFGDWLGANAIAYLNLDSSTSGQNFGASASPTLAHLVRGAAEDVKKGLDASRSVWEARSDGGDWSAFAAQRGEEVTALTVGGEDTGISPLGSGSDYTGFLMRYGVASTDFSFHGGPGDPVYHYHSIYDNHNWLAKYGDVGFHKHVEGAQIIGLMTLRLADSLILPFNTTQYAYDLGGYRAKIEDLKKAGDFDFLNLAPLGKAIETLTTASNSLDAERHSLLEKLHDILPGSPKRSYWTRLRQAFSFHPCSHAHGHAPHAAPAMERWEHSDLAARLASVQDALDDSAVPTLRNARPAPRPHLPKHKAKQLRAILKAIRKVNKKLQHFESGFISEKGIKDREWYRHKGTSPGKWLGYGATTFPALTEALTIEKDADLAQREADELTEMITQMAKRLEA